MSSKAPNESDRRIFIRDFRLPVSIGIHDFEKKGPQTVVVNVDLLLEPAGGAHRDHAGAAKYVGDAIDDALRELAPLSSEQLVEDRYARFRRLGAVKVAPH